MAKALEKTALWLAMTAVAVNGQVFAQGADEPPVVETYQEAAAPAQPVFSNEQIEQMVAPVALYPDGLLAQVLMAATYPLEVVQADQWLKNNRGLEGEALDDAVAAQPWDPSVKTLVFFPSVLERMAQDLAWTQDLGDAFLAQEADVMGAVQRLRHEAQEAGNLVSNSQQIVRTQGSTIVVEPADPTVVYVPSYNPATVYGTAWAPATTYYPATYSYTSAYPTWVVFGTGLLVGALLTAAIDWSHDDYYYVYPYYRRPYHHHHINYVYNNYWDRDWDGPRYGRPGWNAYRPAYLEPRNLYVDKSRTVNIEKNYVRREWEHNPVHRHNVTYRDPSVAKRFVEADSTRRVDRDGTKLFGGDGAKQIDRSGVQQLDRDALRRLDRSQPAMLPADKATREALQGNERERRARIMSGERDTTQFGAPAKSPEAAAQWRHQNRELEQKRLEGGAANLSQPTTRQFEAPGVGTQAKPSGQMPQLGRPEATGVQAMPRARELSRETKTMGKSEGGTSPQFTQGSTTRRSLESGTQRVDPSQMQKRSEPGLMQQRSGSSQYQYQQRVQPQVQQPTDPRQYQYQQRVQPQVQQRQDPRQYQFQQRVQPQVQQRQDPHQYQYQQRVVPKQAAPTVQRAPDAATRQFSQQQRSGGQSTQSNQSSQSIQQNKRKRNDDSSNN